MSRSRLSLLLLIAALQAQPLQAAAPPTPTTEAAMAQAVAVYERGDWPAAQAAFERLSRIGVPGADFNLAIMHLRRELPSPSVGEAVRLMTRAAENGFVTAMVGLAQLHERGGIDGRRNLAEAHRWFLRAAQAGSVDAQVEAGTAFYLGRGAAQDSAAAAHWYREAAKRGDSGAQYLLASMYETGLGVPRDLRLARYWYEVCARSGDVAAPAKVRALDAQLAAEPAGPAASATGLP